MCLPALAAIPPIVQAAVMAATTAASVAATVVTTIQQQQIAEQQAQTARRQQEFNNAETLRRLQQERDAASEKAVDVAKAQADAQGKVQALSGAGVSGRAIGQLRQATLLQSKTDLARVQKQERFAVDNARASLEANELNTQAKLDSIERPNYLASGLQILGTATEGGVKILGHLAEDDGGSPGWI